MQTLSCFSKNLDPYRAGVEIAQQLSSLQPEIIFLYCSIHYQNTPELLEAIYTELSPCRPVILGNSGYGVFTNNSVADIGVSAVGIQTNGQVQWHIEHRTGIRQKPYEVAKDCLQSVLSQSHETPKLLFVSSDFRTDSSELIRAFNDITSVPMVGGLAADDYLFKNCTVFANDQQFTDGLAIVSAEGALAFDIQLGNCPLAVGNPGVITQSHGTTIHTINQIPIMDFIENELGKPLDHVDKGTLTLKTIASDANHTPKVRSLLFPDDLNTDRSLHLLGSVSTGEFIQLCIYPSERMLSDVSDVCEKTRELNFQPDLALIFSCAGRRIILGTQVIEETRQLLLRHPRLNALAGFPSFGEFAPCKTHTGYSKTAFHNMTYVQVLLGSPE